MDFPLTDGQDWMQQPDFAGRDGQLLLARVTAVGGQLVLGTKGAETADGLNTDRKFS